MSKQRLFTEIKMIMAVAYCLPIKLEIITNNFSDYSNQSQPTYCMLINHEWPVRKGNTATVHQTQYLIKLAFMCILGINQTFNFLQIR